MLQSIIYTTCFVFRNRHVIHVKFINNIWLLIHKMWTLCGKYFIMRLYNRDDRVTTRTIIKMVLIAYLICLALWYKFVSESCLLFVCLGLTSILNIWGHIATVATCSRYLTNVLPHRNAIPQTQDMTPHHVTVYRNNRADMSLCYPLMRNVIATHFNVFCQTLSGNPSPTFHTYQLSFNLMMLVWW